MQSITPQAVYQAIAKGKLKSVIEGGKKFVIVDAEEVKPVVEDTNQPTNQLLINDLLKQLKKKDKHIKQLTKQLLKCSQSKEDVLMQYIQELKQIQLPKPEEEIIVKAKKSKKKKK